MKPFPIGRTGTLVLAAALAPLAAAQDLAAGKARAESACAACHGVNGVSVSDTIPNLAGQKSAYLQSQTSRSCCATTTGITPSSRRRRRCARVSTRPSAWLATSRSTR
jgi:hypothetical protein